MMAIFVALQIVRTKSYRNKIVELRDKLDQKLIDRILQMRFPGVDPDLYPTTEYDDPKGATFHGAEILDIDMLKKIADGLLEHIWLIGINEISKPLFNSDNPVVKIGHQHHLFIESDGFLSTGIKIAYPLNPQRVLILCENTHFGLRRTWHRGPLTLTLEDVERYNDLQVSQSHRQIFSSVDDFERAASLCSQNPEICKPNREAWSDAQIVAAVDKIISQNTILTIEEFEKYQQENSNADGDQ